MSGRDVEDQGEWERCRSPRRMFLALLDAGEDEVLDRLAIGLMRIGSERLPGHPKIEAAQRNWGSGEEPADRVYLTMVYAAQAFGDFEQAAWVGGGDVLVCASVRQLVPLAPPGFSRVARLEGNPSVQANSARCEPVRSTLNARRR